MVKVSVLLTKNGSKRETSYLKEMTLASVPSKKDKIVLDDEDGQGQVYTVFDIHFADNGKTDVFVQYVTNITDYNSRLLGGDPS